jgi:hypothetical protein
MTDEAPRPTSRRTLLAGMALEPSTKGGAKIARVITTLLTTHDFTQKRSEIYVG